MEIKKEILEIKSLAEKLVDKTSKLLKDIEINELTLNDQSPFTDMLLKEEWPNAVPSESICDRNNEKEKEIRAKCIVEEYKEYSENSKRILDFGCGEGHVAFEYAKTNEKVVGYDLIAPKLKITKNLIYTTDLFLVKDQGPYDFILLYDVLDHVKDVPSVLKDLHGLLKDDGKIVIRCHPWSSRHAGHVYPFLNKAFIHIFFSYEEINKLISPDAVINETKQKILNPVSQYNSFFDNAGFKHEKVITKDLVERFFKHTLFENFLIEYWGNSVRGTDDFKKILNIMSISFIDYVLHK